MAVKMVYLENLWLSHISLEKSDLNLEEMNTSGIEPYCQKQLLRSYGSAP